MSASNGTGLAYDPLGRLWQVTRNGATTRFEYDGDRLVTELDASGAVLRRYAWGEGVDEPLVDFAQGVVTCAVGRFLNADERGSIVAQANCAGARAAINSYDESLENILKETLTASKTV